MSIRESAVTRTLTALLLASLAITAVLGWQVKTKADRITLLSERNDRLNGLVDTLNRANHDLAAQVQDMADRHRKTLTLAAQAEADKRRMAAELESRNADLRRALREQSDWATTPVPGPVAAGVNAAIDRVRNSRPGGHHEI